MDYDHVKKQLGYGIQTESKDNAIKAIEQLTARVRELEEERDEADRRAGAAERIQERDREAAMARDSWLRKAKEQWGVSNSVSFDVVWDEALQLRAKLSQSESERMALGEHLSKQLAASQAYAEQLREKIEALWDIIDDIDSYGDMAKADDKLFRSLVEKRQKDRWETGITTDGYVLNMPIPHDTSTAA